MPHVERCEGARPSAQEIEGRFRQEGLEPHSWSNGPGDTYDWHAHAYHKVLYCLSGSIDFHTRSGGLHLEAGDRLDLEAGTDHAATVGPEGVQCMEAPRSV